MPQKKFALIFLLLNSIFINFTFSQKISEVDKIVAKYPKSFDSTEQLAERIEKDFDSDAERARAIYGWIAFNIRYDYNAYLNPPRVQGFSYSTEADWPHQAFRFLK